MRWTDASQPIVHTLDTYTFLILHPMSPKGLEPSSLPASLPDHTYTSAVITPTRPNRSKHTTIIQSTRPRSSTFAIPPCKRLAESAILVQYRKPLVSFTKVVVRAVSKVVAIHGDWEDFQGGADSCADDIVGLA
jgi:hypothetical protein